MNKKKKKVIKADESFDIGFMQIDRFGENVLYSSNISKEEHAWRQQKYAENLPKVILEVDEIINAIVDIVKKISPELLLHRAWFEMAFSHMGIECESSVGNDQVLSFRLVEYLQSIIAAIKPNAILDNHIVEDDWNKLRSLVKALYDKINLEYQICRTAYNKINVTEYDDNFEDFYYKAQIYWCNVRRQRYAYHEQSYLKDILLPHSDVLHELFGITAAQLIEQILRIRCSLEKGFGDVLLEFKKSVAPAFKIDKKPPSEIEPNVLEYWESIFNKLFGLDLFDLEKITNLPKRILEALSWSQGEDAEFFSEDYFRGWPLRVLPIFKRPFIKLNGHYYCFELCNLLDRLYRILYRIICQQKQVYRNIWNEKQKIISEQLPFKYLEKILVGATIYRNIRYKWYPNDTNKTKDWCEADGLLLYDDFLFILEIKAGAFTYTSPTNDSNAHVSSLKELVSKPAKQGYRFLKYLTSADKIQIFNQAYDQLGVLAKGDFRHIVRCVITLERFTEFAAQIQHVNNIGLELDNHSLWVLSVDDLRVYADIFKNPLVFLHFVEQRMKASVEAIRIDDELDHLGAYIKHNWYPQYIINMQKDNKAQLSFYGYRTDIDKFFYEKRLNPNTPCAVVQKLPERLAEIIRYFGVSKKHGRAIIVSYLLDCDFIFREKIEVSIERILTEQLIKKRPLPMSFYGEAKLTIFCWQDTIVPYSIDSENYAVRHTQSVMLVSNEEERVLLGLIYSRQGALVGVHWQYVHLNTLSNEEFEVLNTQVETLKHKRFADAYAIRKKIGRNELCPCGSGKKYKRCCLGSYTK